MPRVFIPAKTVIFKGGDTKEIMKIFDKAIKKFKADNISLASLGHADSSPKDATFITRRLADLEALTGKALGADKIDLPEYTHELSAEAFLLYNQYKNFLVNHLMDHKGEDTFALLTKKKIMNRSALVTHLLLQLAAEALNDQQQDKSDNLMLKILDCFFNQLIQSNVFKDRSLLSKQYFTGFADKLFNTHNKWQLLFLGRVDTIQKLNLNKDKINKAFEELVHLRHAIVAAIIYECATFIKCDLPSKHALNDYFIEFTFRHFLAKLETINNENIDIFQTEMTAFTGDLKNKTLNELFHLLVETNKLAKVTEKIGNIIVGAGWFPFIAGIINMDDFGKRYGEHFRSVVGYINKLVEKKDLPDIFKNLKVAILRCKDLKLFNMVLDQAKVVEGLTELNNPHLLQQLSSRFQGDITDLLSLQNDISCSIIDKNKIQQLLGSVTVRNTDDADLATVGTMKTTFFKALDMLHHEEVAADDLLNSVIMASGPIVKYHELSLFYKGILLFQSSQYQDALDCFNSIKSLEDDKLFYNKGLCHLALGNIREAKAQFDHIKESSGLVQNATLLLQKKEVEAKPATSPSILPLPSVSAIPADKASPGRKERKSSISSSSSLAFFSTDSVLAQFEKFMVGYTDPIETRVNERGLEVAKYHTKAEMKSKLKSDVKSKSKKVYIYPINEHDNLEWHYFYSLHDGKKTVTGKLSPTLVPETLRDYYTNPDKQIFAALKRYLLIIIFDKKVQAHFAKSLGIVEINSEEEFTQATEDVELQVFKAV